MTNDSTDCITLKLGTQLPAEDWQMVSEGKDKVWVPIGDNKYVGIRWKNDKGVPYEPTNLAKKRKTESDPQPMAPPPRPPAPAPFNHHVPSNDECNDESHAALNAASFTHASESIDNVTVSVPNTESHDANASVQPASISFTQHHANISATRVQSHTKLVPGHHGASSASHPHHPATAQSRDPSSRQE